MPSWPFDSHDGTLSFATGVVVGGATVLVCAALFRSRVNTRSLPRSPSAVPTRFDHVVLNTPDETTLQRCVEFYGGGFGMKLEGMQKYRDYAAGKQGSKPGFPSLRLNSTQLIDLFPKELEAFACKNRAGGVVDHMCVSMSADNHHATLLRLRELGYFVSDHGVRYGGEGHGYSTYFHDPTGLWVELRNYDTARWTETKALAKECNEPSTSGK